MQLPFEAGNHGYKADEGKIEITGASNMIVFQKKIKEGSAQLNQSIMIGQRFFDPKNRYIKSEGDVKTERAIDEYVVNKVYGC